MNKKEEKLKFLHQLSNEEDIHKLLEELLPEMGYNDVTITHERGGVSEYGKDLVCSMYDHIENRKEWTAFVVKKGVVSGNSKSIIQGIESQIIECFKYEYKSIILNERIRINKVKVVTNHKYSNSAEKKIYENRNLNDRANVSFWNDNLLIKHIDKYYPKYWLSGSKAYKKYIEIFEERIKINLIEKALGFDNKKIEKIVECAIKLRLHERIFNKDGTYLWKSKDADSIIKIPENTIIIGQPGCGKTYFFNSLSKEIILQNSLRNQTDYYPIITNFRELAKADFNLETTIRNYFNSDTYKSINIDVKEIIENSRCAIFIDALDEVGKLELKEKALVAISEFNFKHPGIKIICSSRPSDYLFDRSSMLGFRLMQIDDLNRQQISEFINNYFGENIIKSNRLIRSLQDTGLLNKLPKTPLTLALITIIFDEQEKEIPATMSDLYGYFVDLLLEKSRLKDTLEIIEIGIKHRLLCYIAKEMHLRIKTSLSISELHSIIDEYSLARGQKFNISDILNEIIEHTGLVYVNKKNEFQFKHLSFQEYFTAYEYFHHRQAERDIFINNFNKMWWQNVALFYAGMSKDAPLLLNEIIDKSKPNNFVEIIINIAGIGRLLQALYNTPIDIRKKGLKESLKNTLSAIDFLIDTDDIKYIFFKQFSKFGIYQILNNWFYINHYSITIIEPLKQLFKELYKSYISDDNISNKEKRVLEFYFHFMTSVLSSPDFQHFNELKDYIYNLKTEDFTLLASVEYDFRLVYGVLPKDIKQRDTIKKIMRKMKIFSQILGEVKKEINKPLMPLDEIKKLKK